MVNIVKYTTYERTVLFVTDFGSFIVDPLDENPP